MNIVFNLRRLLLILAVILFVSGCAEIRHWQIENTCSNALAYGAGEQDAEAGFPMDYDFASVCPSNQSEYNASYKKGYNYILNQKKQREIKKTCSSDEAYATGVNEGRQNKAMNANYASICPKNQSEYNQQYIKGYQFGLEQYSKQVHININNNENEKRKHYSKYSCLYSSLTLGQVCGYDCMVDNFGNVYCGKNKHDNCVKDSSDKIECGHHCQVLPNNKGIKCDKQSYSSGSDSP